MTVHEKSWTELCSTSMYKDEEYLMHKVKHEDMKCYHWSQYEYEKVKKKK